MKTSLPYALVLAFMTLLLSSCYKGYTFVDRVALSEQQLDIETTVDEMKVWQTNDLAVHYHLKESGNDFELEGFVKIRDSLSYSFPRTDFLIVYVYLLDAEGKATSRHVIRPRVQKYYPFPDKSRFRKTIPRDEDTSSFAFGYFGNFVDSESGNFRGGRLGVESFGWEIYHNPF